MSEQLSSKPGAEVQRANTRTLIVLLLWVAAVVAFTVFKFSGAAR